LAALKTVAKSRGQTAEEDHEQQAQMEPQEDQHHGDGLLSLKLRQHFRERNMTTGKQLSTAGFELLAKPR
jgi:hypothetical protein